MSMVTGQYVMSVVSILCECGHCGMGVWSVYHVSVISISCECGQYAL